MADALFCRNCGRRRQAGVHVLVAQWYSLPFFLRMGSLIKKTNRNKGCADYSMDTGLPRCIAPLQALGFVVAGLGFRILNPATRSPQPGLHTWWPGEV